MHGPRHERKASTLPEAQWRKSRYSNPSGNCVELAMLPTEQVAIRDSSDPDGPALILSQQSVAALLANLRAGFLNHRSN